MEEEVNIHTDDKVNKSNFAQTDESIETSPCYFGDQGETKEGRKEKRDNEFQLDIIVDSGAARSTMSLKQWREIEQRVTGEE